MSLSLIYALTAAGMWMLIVGEVSLGQMVMGLLIGAGMVLITKRGASRRVPLREIPRRLTYLMLYFVVLVPYDIVRSNLDLARRLLRGSPDIRPGIIGIHLGEVTESTSALIAHAITMTPGELVIEYSEDGKTIYVHLIDATDVESKRAAFWRTYNKVLERALS